MNYVVMTEVDLKGILINNDPSLTRRDWIEYIGPDLDEARHVYGTITQSPGQREALPIGGALYKCKYVLEVPHGETPEGVSNEQAVDYYIWED